MTTATWPASLPQAPLSAGYSESPVDNTVRTKMDAGPAKTRQRYTSIINEMAVVFVMTASQLATFESFYETSISGGAQSYDWTHPRTSSAITCRIVGGYKLAPYGCDYAVSFKLEVLP